MAQPNDNEFFDEKPEVTASMAIREIVRSSRRSSTPVRRAFVRRGEGENDSPGVLADMVRSQDRTGLLLELLLLTKASSGDFDVTLPLSTYARALNFDLPESATARSTISKALRRLQENYQLIEKGRAGRWAHIQLLNEGQTSEAYTRPKTSEDPWFNLSHAFWTESPDGREQPWYVELSLPGIAVLLIALWYRNTFHLPAETASEWFGLSPDSLERGLSELVDLAALDRAQRYRTDIRSPQGYVRVWRYTLLAPFDEASTKRQKTKGVIRIE